MKKRIARIATALMVVAAFGATAASAAQAHEWTIKGETLVKHELASESLSFSKASEFYFAVFVAKAKVEWVCSPTFEGGSIAQGGKGTMQIGFSSCSLGGGGSICQIHPLTNAPLNVELIEVAGVLYLKFIPKEGETLFRFQFGGDPNCTVNSEWKIEGNFVGKIGAAKTSQAEHSLEFAPAYNTAAGVKMHFGPEKAELIGGFTNALSGKFAGASWAAE